MLRTPHTVILAKARISVLKGFLFAALSAICYGTNPLGALHLYAQGYAPETVLFYRFFTAALLLLVVLLAQRARFRISLREFGVLVAFGFLFAVSSLTYYASFKYMDAGLASTLLFLYPLEVSVLMAIFFKEKIKFLTMISIAISMAGVALLYHGGDGTTLSTVGLALVFASSLSYAIYMVMAKGVNLQMGSVKMTFYAISFCMIFLLLYSVTFGSGFYQSQFLGLGLYAWCSADGAIAHIYGKGSQEYRIYPDSHFWSFGARDRRDYWCSCFWRIFNGSTHSGHSLDTWFSDSDCG